MISFRFYVVSTVAFFLALAVGVVVGSVLDGRIADSLQDRLDGVEQSLDETVDAIDAKKAQIDQLERYVDESAPFAIQGRLDGAATLVTAETGVDPSWVEDAVRRLRQAGSRVEGIVWIDRRMDLLEDSDRAAVAELTGLAASGAPEDLRAAAWASLVESASGGPAAGPNGEIDGQTTVTTTAGETGGGALTTAPGPTTTLAPGSAPEPIPPMFERAPLVELADVGLVRLQSIDGQPPDTPAGELVVVSITGVDSTLAAPGLISAEIATAAAGSGLPTVVAAAFTAPNDDARVPESERAEVLPASELADNALISTVDDLELVAGRVATVLALADLREGRSGRYGLRPDADGILPPWQGP